MLAIVTASVFATIFANSVSAVQSEEVGPSAAIDGAGTNGVFVYDMPNEYAQVGTDFERYPRRESESDYGSFAPMLYSRWAGWPEKRAPMDRAAMVRFGKRAPMDRAAMVRFGKRAPMDRAAMVRFGKRAPLDRSVMCKEPEVINKQLIEFAYAFTDLEVSFVNGSNECIKRRIFLKPTLGYDEMSCSPEEVYKIQFTLTDRQGIEDLLNKGFLKHAEGACPLCGLVPWYIDEEEDELLEKETRWKKQFLVDSKIVRAAWINEIIEDSCATGGPCPVCAMVVYQGYGLDVEKTIDDYFNLLEEEKREKRKGLHSKYVMKLCIQASST